MSNQMAQSAKVDETKLNQFIGQMLSDLGGAASVALVGMGDALGLYKTRYARGPDDSGRACRRSSNAPT